MRDGMIDVKGKGSQHTYWVKIKSAVDSATSEASSSGKDGHDGTAAAASSLRSGIATKVSADKNNLSDVKIARLVEWNVAVLSQRLQAIQRENHLDDDLDTKVLEQLRAHVEGIAHMYRKNPFHNFEVSLKFAWLIVMACLV